MIILIMVGVVLIIIGIFVWISDLRFQRKVREEIKTLLEEADAQPTKVFSYADLEGLPEPVANYVRRNVQQGEPLMNTAKLHQHGMMRLAPDGDWKPFNAEQYFTRNPLGFIWLARVRFMPFIWVSARDRYVHQQGNMLIKILSVLTVANADGFKTSSAALIRLISEFMWMPTILADRNIIHWEAVDEHQAKAVVNDHGLQVSLLFDFDEAGDISQVSAERFRSVDDTYPTEWIARVLAYRQFGNVRIPSEAEVIWMENGDEFNWLNGTISEIEYNLPGRVEPDEEMSIRSSHRRLGAI